MKLKFKIQPYQTEAVASIIDCFTGQPNVPTTTYCLDPGVVRNNEDWVSNIQDGFRNKDIVLTEMQLLQNIHNVQRRQNLPISSHLVSDASCKINLDVEMETGTGKTYCYIKTIFEMNKRYGWSKFIIVVPSIAIREGVYKSLQITSEHFAQHYDGKKARFFIYNSSQLHQLESFSSDSGINIMVINIQAFNATGKDNRRIYEELDEFQSRRPIDVISANRPILILDEPQKMEGKKTLNGLNKFKPLMILRYSATHKTTYNKVYRLDALDAYNQKLVKKIAVRGISVKGLAGTEGYLYLESINISKKMPMARLELEIKQNNGIKRVLRNITKGDDLLVISNGLEEYRGFVVTDINAINDTIEFKNGYVLSVGEATGDLTEDTARRIQIRETIRAHLEKERSLFSQGIKVLSLFFIDEVAKYRDYSQPDNNGCYARIFEEEYIALRNEYCNELLLENDGYREYLLSMDVSHTHNGYFSIDKKSKQLSNPKISKGLSDDVDAYDLILKDKEKLLSFDEPTRFIFSHSALREGWDNPNVFVMCMLKHSDNTISRRQEVGRGLRLSVNKNGDRQDHPATVHQINVLSVIVNESYKDFVTNLQKEISESLSSRSRKADLDYFKGKIIHTEDENIIEINDNMAKQIYKYLLKNDYLNEDDSISELFYTDKEKGNLAQFPTELEPYQEQILSLIENIYTGKEFEMIDERKIKGNKLNGNFEKKEFQELWNRINQKAIYTVDFDSEELIKNCINVLNKELNVAPLQYTIQEGIQKSEISDEQLKLGQSFKVESIQTETYKESVYSKVRYDLIGILAENCILTRKTIVQILKGIDGVVFDQFKINPESFIAETSRLIKEQKASIIIEKLSYDSINDRYDASIFTAEQKITDMTKVVKNVNKHIYDYVVIDSQGIERNFVEELDRSKEVVVYAKLPRGFLIPTPVGDYNPDWAISFKEGSVKHIYFVAETKGSMSSLELRGIEGRKIECARKFFEEINNKNNQIKYDVVTNYSKLMELVNS